MQTSTENKKREKEFLIPTMYSPSMWKNSILLKECYTYEDYSRLPEGAPYQLIGGQLIMTPHPTPYHQEISMKLAFTLRNFVQKNSLGHVYFAPLDVYLGDKDVYQPDIIFIRKEREAIIGEINIEGPPDIVVEILSPTTAYYDLRKKFKVYEQCSVSEYWIIDPQLKKVEVYENKNIKFQIYSEAETERNISSKILEGFTISLADIF